MPLPYESRSLSYSQNRNLALNLCLPQTWTPEPPPRQDLVRSKGDHRYSCWQHRHRAGLVQGLTWCGCGVPTGFLMFWAVGQEHHRASAALPSEQTPLLLRYHRIKLLRNREIISSSIQVKQVKGSSFHELWNHSESCLACLGFTVSLFIITNVPSFSWSIPRSYQQPVHNFVDVIPTYPQMSSFYSINISIDIPLSLDISIYFP